MMEVQVMQRVGMLHLCIAVTVIAYNAAMCDILQYSIYTPING